MLSEDDAGTGICSYPEVVPEPFRVALGVVGPADGRRYLSTRVAHPLACDVTCPVAEFCNDSRLITSNY